MKVFQGNYDGRREAMVAARNQKDAAQALGTSVHSLRSFYSSHKPESDNDLAATLEPGVVWLRSMRSYPRGEWVKRET